MRLHVTRSSAWAHTDHDSEMVIRSDLQANL
jgi:hypothetical protein